MHLIFSELFGMDESGFIAFILAAPENYDSVRKLICILRHYREP